MLSGVLLLFSLSFLTSVGQRADHGYCQGLGEIPNPAPPSVIEGLVEAGREVRCRGIRLEEPLRLSQFGRVTAPFVVEGSSELAALEAAGVTFEDRFSISTSTVSEDVDLSNATFDDLADFGGVTFRREFSIDGAVFRGIADYRRAEFAQSANFSSAIFDRELDLFGAEFDCSAEFTEIKAGSLILWESSFAEDDKSCEPEFAWELRLFNTAVSDTLNLRSLNHLGPVEFDKVSWGRLLMDPDVASSILDPTIREVTLHEIEEIARANSDLATANDAVYRLRESQQSRLSAPLEMFSRITYEGMGGFLVRPIQPLLTLFSVAVIGALVRYATNQHWLDNRSPPRRREWHERLWICFKDAVGRLVAPAPSIKGPSAEFAGWLSTKPAIVRYLASFASRLHQLAEWALGKVYALFLLAALASSSPATEPIVRALAPSL